MGTEIVPIQKRMTDMRAYFKARETEIGVALARVGITPQRILRAVFTAAQKNPDLYGCELPSIYKSVLLCAQAGLIPDGVTQQAHLIPFKNKKRGVTECQLLIGYRGMLTLVRRSGEVDAIWSCVVREKDEFSYSRGTEQTIKHVPYRGVDGGGLVACYAVARFKTGGTDFEIMEGWEVNLVRNRSGAKDDGPWVTDTAEMWRKTVLRRLCKRLPQSEDAARLIELDARAMSGAPQEDDVPLVADAEVTDTTTGEVTSGATAGA